MSHLVPVGASVLALAVLFDPSLRDASRQAMISIVLAINIGWGAACIVQSWLE